MPDPATERILATFGPGITGANYALNLIGLAEVMVRKKHRVQAFELARKAIAVASGNPEVRDLARTLLGSLVPRYHLPMMNDARRNLAWDEALRSAIRPGTRVLEIGTGGGMLAMMAARAGAGQVITCESDPVLAALARELISLNGYSSCVKVISRRSQELTMGDDLDQPADILVCDIFADDLVGFDPLPALADSRRLLTPGAPTIPRAGSIRLALANWRGYDRYRAVDAGGFDITPTADFAPTKIQLRVGYPDLSLGSADSCAFEFDFGMSSHARDGRIELSLSAIEDCLVNGIVQWIRLELDEAIFLEAKPEPGAIFFSSPNFHPLEKPVRMRRGDVMRIVASYAGKHLAIWPVE